MGRTRNKNKRSKFHGRISIDFPPDLYEEMKLMVKSNNQTLRSFIVGLVAKDFDFDLEDTNKD